MKKMIALMIAVVMLTGCTNLSDEQRAKVVDLVISGIQVAEQVYMADAQTKEDSYTVAPAMNGDVNYQLTLAYKLLKADGKQFAMSETGESYELTLKHFVVKMLELQSEGKTETPLRIKTAVVKDKVVTSLMYCLRQEDGTMIDEQCPSCCAF
jgi:uncharacterized protein YwgA